MKQVVTVLFVALTGMALAACGGGDDESASDAATSGVAEQSDEQAVDEQAESRASDGEAGPPPAAADEEEEAPAEVTLEFEDRELVSLANRADSDSRLGAVTVAVPVEWIESSDFEGIFGPEDDPFGAQFSVGATCGGGCVRPTAAEWAEVAEEVEFGQFRDEENFEVEIEEDLADGKILVATNSFGVHIVNVARWIDGRVEYFYWRFTTSDPDLYPPAQFEQACREADISDLPESSST